MRDAVSFPGSGPLVTIRRSMSLYYRVGARMHCPQYGRSTVGFVQVPLVPVDPGLAIGNFKFFCVGLAHSPGPHRCVYWSVFDGASSRGNSNTNSGTFLKI